MDIHCPHCGEPWDMDELHYLGLTFNTAWKRFQREGCALFGSRCNDSSADPRIAALYDALGNDPDGCAALLEDLNL